MTAGTHGAGLPRLRVLTTQEAVVPERLPGSTVVVLDVLIATTTLVTILENGARRVFAAGNLHDAEHICRDLEGDLLVRGGEQDALMIDGYDRGPFPGEYSPESVEGKDVVFVSTNGTRALARTASAERLLVANLRNAPASAHVLEQAGADSIFLVCAGSKGGFALEDFIGAGVLLSYMDTTRWRLNDAAWLALDLVDRHRGRIPELMLRARAARWFAEHDRQDILDFVADVGASEIVAEVRSGELLRVTAGVEVSHDP
jgi:2-phosphosulfolactate phosphatase